MSEAEGQEAEHAQSFPTKRWRRWHDDLQVIRVQVTHLYEKQKVWAKYSQALRGLDISEAAHIMHDWIMHNYVESMTMGVRRMVDKSSRDQPVSIYELLVDIAEHVEEVTEQNFVANWRPRGELEAQRAVRAFRGLFPSGIPPRSEEIQREASLLRESAKSILLHADKRIAHIDRKVPVDLPKWTILLARHMQRIRCGHDDPAAWVGLCD